MLIRFLSWLGYDFLCGSDGLLKVAWFLLSAIDVIECLGWIIKGSDGLLRVACNWCMDMFAS